MTPNVFITNIPPSQMTATMAKELGIAGRTGVVYQLSPLELEAAGLPVYANPSLANTYNVVGPRIAVPVPGGN
jgi:hypothetical protein